MSLSQDLIYRNLIKDTTLPDTSWLDTPRTFYLGVDCSSADSMTIGNLAVFLMARRLLEAGWKTVLLVGGATSLVGDPGGKLEERQLKTREEIQHNVAGIKAQVEQLFAGQAFTLVDNYDWFKDVGYLEFLRDVGKHYSMTELLQRDFVADRLGEGGNGISYAEFSYSLIQGFDYWHLYKEHHVELQIGGSDQWGNMLSGVPLIRKKENAEVHALSMPLVIDKSTGRKFGKSEAGAIWLDPTKTSPYVFYQFWFNVSDESVEDFLKIYTFLHAEQIADVMAEHIRAPHERTAQKKLAYEVTSIMHGNEATEQAIWATKIITGEMSIDTVDAAVVDVLSKELPCVTATSTDTVIDVVVAANLASSKGEARRLLQSGAIYINGNKVSSDAFNEFSSGNYVLLRKGKALKDSALVKIV